MKTDIDIELSRQALHPGEKVSGRLTIQGASHFKKLSVSLQGEEVLGANSIVRSFILPVVEESLTLAENGTAEEPTSFPFEFEMPEYAPPSYASENLRCQYSLKAHLRRGGFHRDLIRRYHLTVLPPEVREAYSAPREFIIEEGPVRLTARLDRTSLPSGESLVGSLLLDRLEEGVELPSRITFRLAAIEESTEAGYHHRQVLWLETHDVEPDENAEYPLAGFFEFPIREDAPFSGSWNTFRVHYGFRVGMYLANGEHVRESLPVRVYRIYHPEL